MLSAGRPGGAGHYVKMVHNGIEYADMQLIAEAYDLLGQGTGMGAGALAEVFEGWNAGDLDSFLIEITARVLRQVDQDSGRPLVEVILDQAEQKGTGRWSVQSALELGVPVTAITEAVFARVLSSQKPQRMAAAKVLGGPSGRLDATGPRRSPTMSATPCMPPRWSPTPRGSSRSRPPPRPMAGRWSWAGWPPSGGVAASSGPGSWTASARPMRPIPAWGTCCSPTTSGTRSARPRMPGGGSWPPPSPWGAHPGLRLLAGLL